MKLNIIKDYTGKVGFTINETTGELYRTLETIANIYLTYSEYIELKDLNDTIIKKCKLHDEQKKATIDIMKVAIRKVLS